MYQTLKEWASSNYIRIPKSALKRFATPRNITAEPVAGCNVTCSACPADCLKRPYGKMTMPTFKNIIDKIHPSNVGLYFMGEPSLNPDIFNMIRYAKSHGVKTSLNTNGSNLIRDYKEIINSNLDKIAVSVDGVTQETFEAYRKGINAENVLQGIKILSKYATGSPLHIQIRTLLFKSTLEEIREIDRFVEQCNLTDHKHLEPIITGWGGKENKDLDILGYEGQVKSQKPTVCPALFRMAVTWNGEVLPCCNDVHGENSFGNINEKTYGKIMWGTEMWMQKSNRVFDICENCMRVQRGK